jgi:hypothetical protein
MHPYSSKAFKWYQQAHKRPDDLGDLNMTNQTNKQTNKQIPFIDRWVGMGE